MVFSEKDANVVYFRIDGPFSECFKTFFCYIDFNSLQL